MTSAALFAMLSLFMLIGMPVAVALGLSSVVTILFFSSDSLSSVALKLFEALSEHYTLLAIPFFILSSAFLSTGGVARRLITFAVNLVGHIKGGLAMASVMACMMFAAVSGSSPATVAAIGTIVIAGMVRSGYTEEFAAGVIANAGTLGILIPPSIVMLVYAAATEVSAARMFMAGFIPGVMMGLILMIAIYVVARIKGFPSQPWPGLRALFRSAVVASGGLMLIVIVLGSIYGGIASPTEAAAVSAVYAFLASVFGYRDMGPLRDVPWRKEGEGAAGVVLRNGALMALALPKSVFDPEVRATIMDAAKVSIMLLFIIANALLLKHVLTEERIPQEIAQAMLNAGFGPVMFLVVVNLILLIGGQFMEPSGLIVIVAPLVFPIAMHLGIDPIHLGVIMVVNMEIGMITPPVGLNLFVTAGVARMPVLSVVRAALPWLAILFVFLILVTYVPWISTLIPNSLMGPEIVTLH